MSLVVAQNLTVRYRTFEALRNFSVSIGPGCTGLLGPNGAGKTTFIKTILGFIKPAVGSATVLDRDVVHDSRLIRQLVGFMPEQDCHIPGISAVAFVAYAGELAGMPGDQALRRAHEVLEYCGLGEARYRLVETYSTGMKQRIKLAQALIHGPKLLLLDEPTNGLDPRGREDMLELVRSISHGKDVNVIVSSHLLPDIERTCDQVVVVAKGELRAQGLISDFTKLDGAPLDVELREPSPAYIHALQEAGLEFIHALGNTVRVKGSGSSAETGRRLLEVARKQEVQVRGYAVATRSLEEVFLEVIR